MRQEEPECGLLGRLDFAAQRRERRAAQASQHVRIAPLALASARPQLAAHEFLVALELTQVQLDVDTEPLVDLAGRERAAPARVARDELPQGIGAAFEECLRQTGWRHDAERVAVAARVFHGDQPLVTGDSHTHGPAR